MTKQKLQNIPAGFNRESSLLAWRYRKLKTVTEIVDAACAGQFINRYSLEVLALKPRSSPVREVFEWLLPTGKAGWYDWRLNVVYRPGAEPEMYLQGRKGASWSTPWRIPHNHVSHMPPASKQPTSAMSP